MDYEDVEAVVAAKTDNWSNTPHFPENWCKLFDAWTVGGMFYGFKLKGLPVLLNYHAARELSEMMYSSAARNGRRGYTGTDVVGLLRAKTWNRHAAAVFWLKVSRHVLLLAYAILHGPTTQEARNAAAAVLAAEENDVMAAWHRLEDQHVVLYHTEGAYDSGQDCWVRAPLFPFNFWFMRDHNYTDIETKCMGHVTDIWSHLIKRNREALDDGFVVRVED
jgi:hypothetical protein